MLSVRQSKTHPNEELTSEEIDIQENRRELENKSYLLKESPSLPPIEEPELSSGSVALGEKRKRVQC